MAVWVRQTDGAIEVGEYRVKPIVAKDTGGYTTEIGTKSAIAGRDLLNVKAQSHTNYGWTVVWTGLDLFTATKVYPDGLVRTRIFEVR